jgi:adenosylmethionine---8-amino-7-oxononanoate aminotransferase
MDKADYRRHLEEADKQYVWHPFTQMQDWIKETPVIIEAGEDCFLVDVNGKRYIDGVSSLWVNIFGHRKKEIDSAITAQLGKIAHSTMLGLSSVPAIELAERLSGLVNRSILGGEERSGSLGQMTKTELNPAGLSRIFYSDNGSTAVEVALKMAFQYWKHKGVSGRHSFLSLKNAYHGDTLGAVSVGGVDLFHNVFGPLLFRTFRAPSPYCYRCELGKNSADCGLACIGSMEDILREHHEEIAAVILEPLVQAAGGMIVAPSGYLSGVRTLCDKYDVLLIADEVATGFGRTGEMFACAHEDVLPDIICLSKGITGGYLPLAATLSTEKIYAAFLGDFNELKTFFHGHSYTGNPLACAAGLACLEIFEREKTLEDLVPKIRMLEKWLEEVSVLPLVGNVRNKGFMAGVELVRDKQSKEPFAWEEKMGWKVAYAARDMGVFIRPLGNVIVIMPPLAISRETLGQMLSVLKDAIVSSVS